MADPRIGILMGSDSDWPVMQGAAAICRQFDVPFEAKVMSAHRTPENVAKYASTARDRGIRVMICGAGKAAHLAGAVAAQTALPVIGVPVPATQGSSKRKQSDSDSGLGVEDEAEADALEYAAPGVIHFMHLRKSWCRHHNFIKYFINF